MDVYRDTTIFIKGTAQLEDTKKAKNEIAKVWFSWAENLICAPHITAYENDFKQSDISDESARYNVFKNQDISKV